VATFQVTIGDRTLRVHLRGDEHGLFARVDDGPDHAVRLDSLHGPLRTLVLGDRRVELLATPTDAEVQIAIGGVQLEAEVVDELHARLAQATASSSTDHVRRELKAPMPGLVVKVLCQPGDDVKAGQPLVVLQAMKMENELSLPRAGTVSSVSAEPGQTVEQGAVLLVVE
jgi:biotin carboxyl carrier protein